MPTEREIIARRIENLIAEKPGLTPRGLSMAATGKPDAMRDLKRGKGSPSGEVVAKFADVLGVSTDYILGRSDSREPVRSEVEILRAPSLDFRGWATEERGIPVRGTGDCADIEAVDEHGHEVLIQRSSFDPDYSVYYMARPPSLIGDREAYAVEFRGESMWPRFEEGERGVVIPRREARAGHYVVVQLNDGATRDVTSVLVKRLVRRTQQYLELQQFNPPLIFRIPTNRVVAVHRLFREGDLL